MACKWVVRSGMNNSFWAFTSCSPGFNYLSKIHKAESIRREYEGRECPICHKKIEINLELCNEELEVTYEES